MTSHITVITTRILDSLPQPLLSDQIEWQQRMIRKNRFVYRATIDDALATQLKPLCAEWRKSHSIDISILSSAPKLSKPGVLLMDMDSTVINMECIDELAKLAGVGEEVSTITEAAMRGELDFAESLRARVATLKGADESILKEVGQRLPLNPGVEELIAGLKKYGWKTAIASGGFTYFAEILKQRLGLDFVIANELEIVDGKLTGCLSGNIVDAQVKAETLGHLQKFFAIDKQQTIAIGDGANDLAMMSVAALGVSYRAKPIVIEQADASIELYGLDNVLGMLS